MNPRGIIVMTAGLLVSGRVATGSVSAPRAPLTGPAVAGVPAGQPDSSEVGDPPVGSGDPTPAAGRFRWPVPEPVTIVKAFDGPAQPWLAGHRGIDLAAPVGSTVFAPAAGTVSFNGFVVDRHLIVIDHGELRSTLEPVTSDLALGAAVAGGQGVGTVSAEAAHTSGAVHWGVRRGEQYIDPALLVGPRPRAVLLE
jgi:murein DD-endopeptidase MepM/ murein hydrolase activator NlpD